MPAIFKTYRRLDLSSRIAQIHPVPSGGIALHSPAGHGVAVEPRGPRLVWRASAKRQTDKALAREGVRSAREHQAGEANPIGVDAAPVQ